MILAKKLKVWFNNNPKDIKAIIDKAMLARAAREKAKKAKETVRKQDKAKRAYCLDSALFFSPFFAPFHLPPVML